MKKDQEIFRIISQTFEKIDGPLSEDQEAVLYGCLAFWFEEIRRDQKEKCVDIMCKNNFPFPFAHDEGLNMVNPNPSPSRREFFKKLIMETS